MTTLGQPTDVRRMTINPGQLGIVREITTAGRGCGADIDTAKFQGGRGEYAFSATADGQVIVSHAVEDSLDGTDRLRNIEKVQFATGNALNIIVGTPGNDVPLNGTAEDDLILGLAGADTLNGLAGNDILVGGPGGDTTTAATYADNFNTNSFGNSTGSANWDPDWVETGDNNSPTNGQIQIDDDVDQRSRASSAASLTARKSSARSTSLARRPPAELFDRRNRTGCGADNDNVTVFFSRDGTNFVQVDQITSTTNRGQLARIDLTLFGTGPFTANAAIRFVASSLRSWRQRHHRQPRRQLHHRQRQHRRRHAQRRPRRRHLLVHPRRRQRRHQRSRQATSGGTADRISILAPSTGTDPETGLPILTITALNASRQQHRQPTTAIW